MSGAAARTGNLMEKRKERYKKKNRRIEIINIESHVRKHEQNNRCA